MFPPHLKYRYCRRISKSIISRQNNYRTNAYSFRQREQDNRSIIERGSNAAYTFSRLGIHDSRVLKKKRDGLFFGSGRNRSIST